MIALAASIGLLICAVTQALSRATLAPPGILYWIGLLLIVAPIFYRLSSAGRASNERLALVAILGLALYGVKVVRDSFVFGYSDEPIHAFNAEAIVHSHHLFTDNPILPITADYPGLEGATSALMAMSGISSFGAGLIVVGASRLILIVSLFYLFRRISNSPGLAGFAVAVYVGNFNFLYFSAEFSYESLGLPLLVFVLMCVAERSATPRHGARAWAVPIGLATAAVVVTHHLSSYALTLTLTALAVLYAVYRKRTPGLNPWPFAALAMGLVLTWLTVAAGNTGSYLLPVLSDAFTQALDTLRASTAPRELFQASDSGSAASSTPLIGKALAFGSIAILAVAVPLGIRMVWRRHRYDPFALLFCVAAAGFFATLALRFVPAAWETGNRASGYLFIGLAFVAAYAAPHGAIVRLAPALRGALLAGALSIVFIGGVISGWPWDSHLAKPVQITADGARLEPEPLGLGHWVGGHLPDGRFAAPAADARMLLDPGGAWAQAGSSPGIEQILSEPKLAGWHLPTLRGENLRFVVADASDRGEDGIRGYAFSVRPDTGDDRRPLGAALKFEQLYATSRIFDSGRIAVYDLESRK